MDQTQLLSDGPHAAFGNGSGPLGLVDSRLRSRSDVNVESHSDFPKEGGNSVKPVCGFGTVSTVPVICTSQSHAIAVPAQYV